MNIETDTITHEFGKLLSVHRHVFEGDNNEMNMISGLHLKFENGDVFNEALADTDEISCDSELKENYDSFVDVSKLLPWVKVINRKVRWCWQLRNQQGYNDAIQYSFANPSDSEIIIQLLVIASEIKTYELEEKL